MLMSSTLFNYLAFLNLAGLGKVERTENLLAF